MKNYPSAKIIPLPPKKDYRERLASWVLKNDLNLIVIAVFLGWLLLANNWCNGQHQNAQYNIEKAK